MTVSAEKVSSDITVASAFNSCNILIEKKLRNLEKRRKKLESLNQVNDKSRLNKEQLNSLSSYNAIVTNIELTKELAASIQKLTTETLKTIKKQEKSKSKVNFIEDVIMSKKVMQVTRGLSCFHPDSNVTNSNLQLLDLTNDEVKILKKCASMAIPKNSSEFVDCDSDPNDLEVGWSTLSDDDQPKVECEAWKHMTLIVQKSDLFIEDGCNVTYSKVHDLVMKVMFSDVVKKSIYRLNIVDQEKEKLVENQYLVSQNNGPTYVNNCRQYVDQISHPIQIQAYMNMNQSDRMPQYPIENMESVQQMEQNNFNQYIPMVNEYTQNKYINGNKTNNVYNDICSNQEPVYVQPSYDKVKPQVKSESFKNVEPKVNDVPEKALDEDGFMTYGKKRGKSFKNKKSDNGNGNGNYKSSNRGNRSFGRGRASNF
ncbi:hypothetical protein A3Q56_04285 [Intoshia linei]|uniref:Caprin-1 dimerization domain-containing protein n=1 Tax=Intoshia linei TaxID=1819745 RepID=A0A177B158_9BILA|nr:hypothetical protein A3Q56_04285 [Intoshia linei]